MQKLSQLFTVTPISFLCWRMIIVTTETLYVLLLRALYASVFSRLERQAGLPFEEWLIFLLNKGQHLTAKNAWR